MESAVDRGTEFTAKAGATLKSGHGIRHKIIASRNPQSNSIVERCHKTLHNMIQSGQIKDKTDLDGVFGFQGVLAACLKAVNSTVHTTSRPSPSQFVFGHDTVLSASFQADWQFVKDCKQRLILQNNKHENAKRTPHACNVGDVVAAKAGAQRSTNTAPTHAWTQ